MKTLLVVLVVFGTDQRPKRDRNAHYEARIGVVLKKVEHIALAVANLDEAIKLYSDAWGLTLEHREIVEDQGLEEAMLRLGDTYIQLLAPLEDDTMVGRFIQKRGEGLHHIAYEVDDLESALESLKDAGMQLIDETPRRGSRDTRVAFVHPKGNRGVLVELVQII